MQTGQTKFRFFNAFFVMTLMLTSIILLPESTQAQTENSVYLPILSAGSVQDVQAAATTCYGSQFSARLTRTAEGRYQTERINVSSNGSYCNDLNIHSSSLAPNTGCMRYNVAVHDKNGKFVRMSGGHLLCRYSERWKVLTYGLRNDESYQIYFWDVDKDPGGRVTLAD